MTSGKIEGMDTLEHLITNYQPSDAAIDLVRNTHITLLVGISGAGKDTIKKRLLADSDYRDIISHTTRAPRSNNGVPEVADVDYHFIDEAEARRMVEGQEFIEAKYVHGTVYGTSVSELRQSYDQRKIAITDVMFRGWLSIRTWRSQWWQSLFYRQTTALGGSAWRRATLLWKSLRPSGQSVVTVQLPN